MNEQKQTHRWIIDAILFTVFIAAFFLNLTGLPLHQWIGVIAAVLAGYHLISHWNWVVAITSRFLKRTSAKARTYYVLDAAILVGMMVIGFTGLIISTWLNLALTNYITWKTVHVAASVITLAAVVLKIGLHSRWIVATARGLFAARPAPVQQPVLMRPVISNSSVLTRRDFLKLAGVVGTASFVAVTQALSNLAPVEAENTEAANSQSAAPVSQITQASSSSAANVVESATAIPTAVATSVPTAAVQNVSAVQPTATVSTASQTASTTCRLICNKKCSFPGRCRRYTDTNGNNLCDNGECL